MEAHAATNIINHECANVNYTEGAPTEVQLPSFIVSESKSRLNHCVKWYKWVSTNFYHDKPAAQLSVKVADNSKNPYVKNPTQTFYRLFRRGPIFKDS